MTEPLTLLVVDDDEVDRMAVRRALRVAGVAAVFHEAQDAAQAVEMLTRQRFDCAFLDYQLGPGSGLDVLRQVRVAGIKTPIVMMTGQGDESIAVKIMKAGATDYMPKGKLSPDSLERCVRNAVRVFQAEMEAARATEALRFMAEASALLATSLDYPTTIARVVELVVPRLGDFCAIEMIEKDGAFRRVAATHVDPARQTLAQALVDSYPGDPALPSGHPKVLQTGQSELCSELLQALTDSTARDEDHVALLDRLNFTSYICVPLLNRGRLTGALTLAWSDSKASYIAADLTLAEELARRAAIAIDNARLYQEAREAVRVRDAFLSIASHELRTPLTTLYGHLELLRRRIERDGEADEPFARSLHMVVEQAKRLNKMIDLLLDLSRIESGQLHIERQLVDLEQLVQRIVEEVQSTVQTHTLQVLGPREGVIVEGDETRLEQVLQNLIQNAIKYSPEGGRVAVAVTRNGDMARVAVTDQGIGIPEEAIPNLFDAFFRADQNAARGVSGMGLGLHIVRHIVEAHGGTIQVTSEPGAGSTFVVEFALYASEAVEDEQKIADGSPN